MNSNSTSAHLPAQHADSPNVDHTSWQRAGSKTRMAAFSLMLVVPLALTGCSDDQDAQCEYDQYGNPYNCQEYSSGSGYRSSGSSHYSKNSSSDSHSGFGSSGSSFSFFGG